jgi:hypothetical protein
MKKLIILMFALTFTLAETSDRPSKSETMKEYDIRDYSWMKTARGCNFIYFPYSSDDTKKFMPASEVKSYFKLKMRNFAKDFTFDKRINGKLPNIACGVTTEIYQYNEKLEIFTGILEFAIHSQSGKNFRITHSIAGSDNQIKKQIKNSIDSIVENFATDYYYMKDLK